MQERIADERQLNETEILDGFVESSNETFMVSLTYAGEGYEGDYDETDPEDEPLLRVDLYVRMDDDPENDFLDDAVESTCSTVSARISKDDAERLAKEIVETIDADKVEFYGYERVLLEAIERAREVLGL